MGKYLYNYKETIKRYNMIKTVYMNNIERAKIGAAILSDMRGLIKYSEYMKFENGLSADEIIGNYLACLYVEPAMDSIEKVFNNEITFDEFFKISFDIFDYTGEYYKKYLKEVKKLG